MYAAFYIDISIQTGEGPIRIGRFDVGSERYAARNLFKQLKGSSKVDLKDMLYIEFMEQVNGLPPLAYRYFDLRPAGIRHQHDAYHA